MLPELFLCVRAMRVLLLPVRTTDVRTYGAVSRTRRRSRGLRTLACLSDLRNSACVSGVLRAMMRACTTALLLLHSTSAAHGPSDKGMPMRFLMLCRTSASMYLLRTDSLLSMYLCLELRRLCRYVMTRREHQRAVEARLKYLILGAFRSGLILFGMALMYASSGVVAWPSTDSRDSLYTVGVIRFTAGLFFKAGRRPFHYWVPDIYAGTPTLTRAYFATVRKAGILGLLASISIPSRFLWVVRAISMLIGVLGAIPQVNLKRMFRYSSIAQVGYLCLGLLGVQALGKTRIVYFLVIYMVTGIHRFRVFLHGTTSYRDLAVSRHGSMNLSVALLFFSLAGIPPLMGFFTKARILQYAWGIHEYRLVGVALLSSVLGVVYSLQVVVSLYTSTLTRRCVETKASEVLSPIHRTLLRSASTVLGTGWVLVLLGTFRV